VLTVDRAIWFTHTGPGTPTRHEKVRTDGARDLVPGVLCGRRDAGHGTADRDTIARSRATKTFRYTEALGSDAKSTRPRGRYTTRR